MFWAVVGCAGWPLWSAMPEDSALVPVGEPPPGGAVDWVEQASSEPDGWPSEVATHQLPEGTGLLFRGALEGAGWDPAAAPATVAGCEGDRRRNAAASGDYTADTDMIVVDVAAAGPLCAAVSVGGSAYGWDLLVFPVDDCDAPEDALVVDGAVIGADLGGEAGGWQVDVAPGRYAVLLAAYAPDDPSVVIDWAIGVSAPAAGSACPALPEGT